MVEQLPTYECKYCGKQILSTYPRHVCDDCKFERSQIPQKQTYKCIECNHIWMPKGSTKTASCPKCLSRKWDGEVRRKGEVRPGVTVCQKCGKLKEMAFCVWCGGYNTERTHKWGITARQLDSMLGFLKDYQGQEEKVLALRTLLLSQPPEVVEGPKVEEQEVEKPVEAIQEEVKDPEEASLLLEQAPAQDQIVVEEGVKELTPKEALEALEQLEWQ